MQFNCRKKCTIYAIPGVYMYFLAEGGAYINELPASVNNDRAYIKQTGF